ncbi:hypothetical protein L210DRAFT_3326110, partial [Boletus edulis BED1]
MEGEGGALRWGEDHYANFEIDKTALLCVSRLRVPDPQKKGKSIPVPRPSIVINGHRIEPSPSYKFLGIIIDHELRFKQHAAYAISKGTKYVLASRRMTRVSRGIKARMTKRLYEGVALPKMLYGIDVWGAQMLEKGRGKKDDGWGARGFGKKMDSVQRLAALHIVGGMRSTASDVLFAHADLHQIPVLIHRACNNATLRMATLPKSHPLNSHIISTLRHRSRHKSPLHRLTNAFHYDPRKFEDILPVRHNPKWSPDVTVAVEEEKNAALLQDIEAETTHDICLYSDGSGIEGGIGGAAVLRRNGRKVDELRLTLGRSKDHTVYEGEIVGMILAVELL